MKRYISRSASDEPAPAKKPKVRKRKMGSVSRRVLLQGLAEEHEFGNSLAKCYVSLLARTLVDQEPELMNWPAVEYYLQECGVRNYAPNRYMKEEID